MHRAEEEEETEAAAGVLVGAVAEGSVREGGFSFFSSYLPDGFL